MTPEEVLLAAADALGEYGWHQGGFGNTRRGMCAAGAISYVTTGSSVNVSEDAKAASRMLVDWIGQPNITSWNDYPGRTKEDVILALKKAARHE